MGPGSAGSAHERSDPGCLAGLLLVLGPDQRGKDPLLPVRRDRLLPDALLTEQTGACSGLINEAVGPLASAGVWL